MPGLRAFTIFLVGLIFSGVANYAHAVYETSLSDTQVQRVVENYFPLNEYAAFARVQLRSPQIDLSIENENIILMVAVEAKVAGEMVHRGHASIELGLSYKPALGGVYLGKPRIRELEIPGVDQKLLAELRGITQSMAQNSLTLIRIYKVKESELNHTLTKSALKNFVVENARLRLVFGFK
jgi:Protein of unknown function (DUF1439)